MGDYFAPDDGYKEPKIKECPVCEGTGEGANGIDKQGNWHISPCYNCEGSGWVDLTPEEEQAEEEAARDNEADLKNDDI